MHLVLVEDNITLARSLIRVFTQEGYTHTHFIDGGEAENWLISNNGVYDLLILDILLPSTDGFTICKHIRKAGIKTPVLMLTSKDTLGDTIDGLDYGADDYMKKPFEIDELLARIRTLLRRPPMPEGNVIEILPNIVIDMKSQKVFTHDKKTIPLTTKEFSVLTYFTSHPNEVINQQKLYDHVFDFAEVQLSNLVEVHIKNIRKKFKTANYEIPLKTIRGAGYRLDI